MAAVDEPVSPPAAKRARLDPDTQFSTLPPSPQTNGNGHTEANGTETNQITEAIIPVATSAPSFEPVAHRGDIKKNPDYESDDEEDVPEQPVAEVEHHSRRDMYLDTVSTAHG